MKLQICHFSDFHFENDTYCAEALKERKEKIVNSIISNSAGYEYCLIAITGDVTFSCKEEDYIFAYYFFQDIITSIKEHYKKVYVFSVPGNHDCDILSKTSAVREVLINSVKETHNYSDILSQITDAQKNYFNSFDSELTSQTWNENMIFNEEICIDGHKVNIIGLNTAWLSKLNDKKDYYYPLEMLPLKSNGDLVITFTITLFS